MPSVSAGLMSTTFQPGCGLSLKQAAQLGGYDHFNWVQVITEHDALAACKAADPIWPSYFALSPLCYHARGLVTSSSTFPITPFFDVPPGGFQYQVDVCSSTAPFSRCNFPVEDNLPWYWDEQYSITYHHIPGLSISQAQQAACGGNGAANCNELSFQDKPSCWLIDNLVPCTIRFTTTLVGVRSDGTGDALNFAVCQTGESLNCTKYVGTGFDWHVFGYSKTSDGRLQNLQPDPDTEVFFDGFKQPGVEGFSQAELEVFAKNGIHIRDDKGITTPVIIDIKPGESPNSINPKNNGKIPVAIISTTAFNAPNEVDGNTLTFGHTGNEASLYSCHPEDVNGDGLNDLVCHFYTSLTAFQAGDTQGILKGKTFTGTPIVGMDSVTIVPRH